MNDETNQGRLEQLVDGIAHLQQQEIQLRQRLLTHSLGSTQQQPMQQPDLMQQQSGVQPQQLQDLQPSTLQPLQQQGSHSLPVLSQGSPSQPQLWSSPQLQQSATTMQASELGLQQRHPGVGQQLQPFTTSSELQNRQLMEVSTLMHRFQSPSLALPGQLQPNVSPGPSPLPQQLLSFPMNVPRQLPGLQSFQSETTSGSPYLGQGTFTPYQAFAGQKGEPLPDPSTLQLRIFAASQHCGKPTDKGRVRSGHWVTTRGLAR